MPVSEDVEELRRRLENALLRGMMQDRDAAPLHQQNGYPVRIALPNRSQSSCRVVTNTVKHLTPPCGTGLVRHAPPFIQQ